MPVNLSEGPDTAGRLDLLLLRLSDAYVARSTDPALHATYANIRPRAARILERHLGKPLFDESAEKGGNG